MNAHINFISSEVGPEWVDVDSSNVLRVAYHPITETLAVEFRSGGLYSYSGVPEGVYTSLAYAESVGRYLDRVVKGVYPYTKHFDESEVEALFEAG